MTQDASAGAWEHMGFDFDIHGFVSDSKNATTARDSLERYFSQNTGRHFERFASRADARRFTSDDVAAIATLSVPLDGEAVVGLLLTHADRLTELLNSPALPPREAAIWEVDATALAADQPLSMIYNELKRIPGINYVRASKLLAGKRPHLVPIRDSVVEQLLGAGTDYWAPMRDVLGDPELRRSLEIVSDGVVPSDVSLLRRLDVILWMEGEARGLGTRRS